LNASHHAGSREALMNIKTERQQPLRNESGCLIFRKGRFRHGVQRMTPLYQFIAHYSDLFVNRHGRIPPSQVNFFTRLKLKAHRKKLKKQ
jgi:hypothetical protein